MEPAILYELKYWAVKKYIQKLTIAKMRMLRRVSGTMLEDKNECIRKELKLALMEVLVCAMENNKCTN